MSTALRFAARHTIEQVEEGLDLAPKFGPDGLPPCITTDATSGEVLMLGWMNTEALQRTLATREAHDWSRSRQVLWHKGGTSGLVQRVVEPRPGRALFEAIENIALRDDRRFPIRPVEYMSGCRRHCTVALQATGKTTYMFGDLPADDESAEQVLVCAALHQASTDGFMARDARPERLRVGILARLPAPTTPR